jgi:hypothetical protein
MPSKRKIKKPKEEWSNKWTKTENTSAVYRISKNIKNDRVEHILSESSLFLFPHFYFLLFLLCHF